MYQKLSKIKTIRIQKGIKTQVLVLCCITLMGCRAKKQVSLLEEKRVDTIFIKTQAIKAPVLTESLILKDLCDTVTKEVVQFKKVFVVDGDSLEILTNLNNELIIKTQRQGRELSRMDSISKTRFSTKKESKHKVVYKKDWGWILGALFLGILLGSVKPWRWLL